MSDLTGPDPAALRVRRTLLWLASRRPVTPPRKVLILQPGGLGSVMMATPLLAALGAAYPEAQFDWVVQEEAAAAIRGNPRLRRLIPLTGETGDSNERETLTLVEHLQREEYDTCFLPDRAGALAGLARRAGIPQRIGLAGREGAAGSTLVVATPATLRHRSAVNLALVAAVGVDAAGLQAAEAEFYPSDADRTAVTRWLVEDFDWLGNTPLVIMHPGGVHDPEPAAQRWPAVRFARLANHLSRAHGARVVLVGGPADRAIAAEVAGMMAVPAANQAGRLSLGEVAALGEVASLYVGNDAGPTHVAAAAGCPVLAIYGPTDPALTAPYTRRTPVTVLWRPPAGAFSWDAGVTVEEAAAAADRMLAG